MSEHQGYMARALQLAARGLFTTDPNPRVGCVIVKDGEIIGQGWHQRAGEAHAEVNALEQVGDNSKGADCYVTLEPCSHFGRTPPCADHLVKSGIKRIYVAMKDPNPIVAGKGIAKLEEAGIEVNVGLMTEQAEQLNRGYCQRMRSGRPYVRSKMAMSLDGRTAMASGESKWITGTESRQNVQKLRAQSSVILTGIDTVLADDPELTVRPEGDWYHKNQIVRQPLRVVVDSRLQIPKQAKLLDTDGKVLIATTIGVRGDIKAEILTLPSQQNRVDLSALMQALAQREMNEVMVEAGSTLNGALLNAGLIDELVIYMAPKVMGDSSKGLFHLPELQTMAQNIDLTITDIRAVGQDWQITAIPDYKERT